jgi:dihydrofolate reductase|tara:strand:- start:189 stop:683 length:495 start_codon:yes stop_codon:yes gene_type:complete
MRISLIVAASENNVIGRDNALPWSLPDDLKFFREKTEGHPILLGRKNYESIGRALPKRRNIIISRQADLAIDGCEVVASVEDAISLAKTDEEEEIFVIGGGEIYNLALPLVDRVYLTRVHTELEGNVYFSDLPAEEWEEVSREEHAVDDRHEYAFTFLTYDRVK